ncbi:MAG: NAD(+) synthase, partial [Eubacteriales bacterium]|nr:NAD(+) synthase [Eubacteriales bacterium]
RSDEPLRDVLSDILATPVSPELLPPENGQIAQKTESLVGPYRLHDFYLYYFVRFGFTPEKIERLAHIAFRDEYTAYEIRHWLRVFIRRFFSQQFKRSCLPDGPKVGRVALSPRGDWRMASDAESLSWLDQLPELDP